MHLATVIAVAAAAVSGLALLGALVALKRVRRHAGLLEREIHRGKAQFDAVVAREVQSRTEELERLLARLRADWLSELGEEARRIGEERRRDVGERERDATARLTERLVAAQQSVEQRFTEWASDVEKLQLRLGDELKRVEARQRQLMTDVEARIGQDAEGLHGQLDEQRQVIARLREDLGRAVQDAAQTANAELEVHASERRRALQELSDRLGRREADLRAVVEREGSEAAQRIQIGLGDIERRQNEQMQRVVTRAAARYSEAATQQFDETIRAAREDSARRLGRELDLAVERFAREAEGVLADRVNQVSDAAAARVEERLARLRSNLEHQRDDALASLEERAHAVEMTLRERLQEIATDAESERSLLEARLHELARRIDELATTVTTS